MGIDSAVLLTDENVQQVVSRVGLNRIMDELIERLYDAFVTFDATRSLIPTRSGFSYESPMTGLLEWMPILSVGDQMLMKLVGYHPDNPNQFSLPTILSSFSLYCAKTGKLNAIVDGTLLTAMRTGAASAIASRALAPESTSEIGIVGCGAQAVTQLHAMSRVFEISQVSFFDIDPATVATFPSRCEFLGDSVVWNESTLEHCVSQADVLCVATSVDVHAGPVFDNLDTRNHLHINAVGSDFPGKTELPIELLQRSYVSPDTLEQAMVEGESQQLDRSQVGLPLSQLLKSDLLSSLVRQTTVFDSTGWALEDLMATELILGYAREMGIGTPINVVSNSMDPKSPYECIENSSEGNKTDTRPKVA